MLYLAKRISLLFLFCALAIAAQGQYTSRLGRFRVTEIKGCAPFTVIIEDTNLITAGECTLGKPCLMNAGNGSGQIQNLFAITYPTAGTFTLSILYQSIGADDITITVDPNIQPAFEVYTCGGFNTSIKITDKNYDQYFVDFNNDGVNEVAMPSSNNQVATHTYGINGTFSISVKGKDLNAADNCAAMVENFTTLSTLPVPQISTLTAIDANQLSLDFTSQTNIQYKLEIAVNNATTFQQFQTLYEVNTTAISNVKPDDNFYCFRLGSFDPCANTNVYSFPVCSQNVDVTAVSDNMNLTSLTSSLGIVETEIRRNNATYTNIPGAPAAFNDPDVVCKTNYCYQVVSNYPGGSKSFSLIKCANAFSSNTPSPVNNISSVVSETSVALEWQQDPLFTVNEYAVFHSIHQSPFSQFSTTANTEFTDANYNTESSICYRIDYTDVCDNASAAGALICPIRLYATIDKKNEITITWSKLKGWDSGVKKYKLQKFDRSGGLMDTYDLGTDTIYVDNEIDLNNQIVQYRVLAEANQSGLTQSVSNKILVTKETYLFYPTAFTPDGVGPMVNETFSVNGQYITKMELKIFDRWGTLLFYTNENTPWDGSQNGRPMPEGTYVWVANVTDLAGRNFVREGTVVILKKRN